MAEVRIERAYLDRLNTQINGLLTMNRLAKERIKELEGRCARLEQATLELAATVRHIPPEPVGSPFGLRREPSGGEA